MMSPSASRTESDTFGPIEVPADRYWGAQTQRSLTISASRRAHAGSAYPRLAT
jgi:fumarate hydratase class II